jgi:hypothetical protein
LSFPFFRRKAQFKGGDSRGARFIPARPQEN